MKAKVVLTPVLGVTIILMLALPGFARQSEVSDPSTSSEATAPTGADEGDSAEIRLQLVRSVIALGKLEQATQVLAAMQGDYGDSALALVAEAELHFARAEYSEGGLKAYEAVKADPESFEAHLLLGAVFESERRMVSARKHYKAAYTLAPANSRVVWAWMNATPDRDESKRIRSNSIEYLRGLETARATSSADWLAAEGDLLDQGSVCGRVDTKERKVPLRVIRNGPSVGSSFGVELTLNKAKPVVTLVDTGASGFIVTRKIAQRAGVEIVGRSALRGLGKEGVRQAELGVVRSLKIANVEFRNCIVRVVDDALFKNFDTQAILGLDAFYQDSLVTLDFGKPEIRLQAQEPLPTDEHGRPDPYSYDRDTQQLDPGFAPVRLVGTDFLLPVVLRGMDGRAASSYFVLDTGASILLVDTRVGEKVSKVTKSGRRVMGLSGEVEDLRQLQPIVVEVLGLGQRYQSATAADLSSRGLVWGYDGLLGHRFLENTVLTLDARNAAVKLELGEVKRRASRR